MHKDACWLTFLLRVTDIIHTLFYYKKYTQDFMLCHKDFHIWQPTTNCPLPTTYSLLLTTNCLLLTTYCLKPTLTAYCSLLNMELKLESCLKLSYAVNPRAKLEGVADHLLQKNWKFWSYSSEQKTTKLGNKQHGIADRMMFSCMQYRITSLQQHTFGHNIFVCCYRRCCKKVVKLRTNWIIGSHQLLLLLPRRRCSKVCSWEEAL